MRSAYIIVLLFIAAVSASASAAITAEVGATTVVIRGLNANAQVYVLGAMLEPRGYHQAASRYETTAVDDNGDGVITVDRGKPIPRKSVWAVVEVATGNFTVAAPAGFILEEHPFPSAYEGASAESTRTNLDLELPSAEILLFRPAGASVWRGRFEEGGDTDGDGATNDTLRIAANAMKSTSTPSATNTGFLAGDVVIVIEPFTLEYLATRLTQ